MGASMSMVQIEQETLLELFRISLHIEAPWKIAGLQLDERLQQWNVHVDYERGAKVPCPVCKQPSAAYDASFRSRRHLNLLHWKTWIHASLPSFYCPNCRMDRILLPPVWAETNFHLD